VILISRALVPRDDGNDLSNLRASLNVRSLADKKRLICDQLREIWTLPLQLKNTAIRRLYLQYHPDKNTDKAEEYKILFQFLQEQIKHLENNEDLDDPDRPQSSRRSRNRSSSSGGSHPKWSTEFENWDFTAKSHKQSRSQYTRTKQRGSRGSGGSGGSFPYSSWERKRNTNNPNPSEGWRWIQQAKIDIRDLQSCLKQTDQDKGYSLICFLAHQVAEKALKGALLALCGLDSTEIESRTLLNHANILSNLRPHEAQIVPELCAPLTTYYQKTRYPDQWPGCTDAPADHYHLEDALRAMKNAEEILRIILSLMPNIPEE